MLQRIGRSAFHIQQPDTEDGKNLVDNRGARRNNEECGIEFSSAEGARGLLSPKRQKVCSLRVDAIVGEQQKRDLACSAAIVVNGNAASFEIT